MKKFISSILVFFMLFSLNFGYEKVLANEVSNYEALGEVVYLIDEYFINNVSGDKIIDGAINGIVNNLGDKNTQYYTKEEYESFLKDFESVQFDLGVIYKEDTDGFLVIDGIVEKSYFDKAGFQVGDKILSINSKPVKLENLSKVLSENLLKKVYKLKIDFTRKGISKSVTINVDPSDLKTAIYKDANQLPNISNAKSDVAYIKISSIIDGTDDEFFYAISKAQSNGKNKLILDLRGNGGGNLDTAINIAKSIVPKGNIISIKDKNGNIKKYTSQLEKPPFEKIAVLTDGNTASSAEIIASAIKDSKIGFTVGTRTYGKGTIQGLFKIKTGGVLKMTIAEYYSRNGSKINNIGIAPTFLVNNILFIDNNVDINSKKFKEVIEYIGYKNNTIGEIQKLNNLNITNKLDKETVDFINSQIYKTSILKDDFLIKAYNELIK